jgi:hypothetical protein
MLTMPVVAQADWQVNNNHSTYPLFHLRRLARTMKRARRNQSAVAGGPK